MKTETSWQRVVELYLNACFADARASQKTLLTNCQSAIFREFATDSVLADYLKNAKGRVESLIPPADSSGWTTLDETENRVLVEITVGPDNGISMQIPFVATRLLLERQRGAWRINDVYEPCHGCNMIRDRIVGQCIFCEGAGIFVGSAKPCKKCDGTGQCRDCVNEKTKGWRRAFFLVAAE